MLNGNNTFTQLISQEIKYETFIKSIYTRDFWGTPDIDRELCDASKTASETSQAASATYFKQWLTARFSAVDTIIKNLQ